MNVYVSGVCDKIFNRFDSIFWAYKNKVSSKSFIFSKVQLIRTKISLLTESVFVSNKTKKKKKKKIRITDRQYIITTSSYNNKSVASSLFSNRHLKCVLSRELDLVTRRNIIIANGLEQHWSSLRWVHFTMTIRSYSYFVTHVYITYIVSCNCTRFVYSNAFATAFNIVRVYIIANG